MVLKKTQSKKPIKKYAVAGLIAVLLIGGGAAFAIHSRASKSSPANETAKVAQKDQTTINYGPPTEAEKQSGNDQKAINVEREKAAATPVTSANVVINADQYQGTVEVRAFVSNVFHTGSCSVTLTHDASVVTRQVTATPNATTTQCAPVDIARSSFTSFGTYTVKVSYTADDNSVTGSATATVDVQ